MVSLVRQHLSLELASESHIIPVGNSANVQTVKFGTEIFITHPESTIIVISHKIESLDHFGSPELTVVAPVSIPLKVTPGVSDLDKTMTQSLLG